jgi:hypothetical protein
MKKIFIGSIVLMGFNVAIILTQMSCKKEASAQVANTVAANLILFYKSNVQELWLSNVDGSNQHKIPIVLANGLRPGEGRLTADGKSVVFEVFTASTGANDGIYSCTLDGGSLKKIVSSGADELLLQDVK